MSDLELYADGQEYLDDAIALAKSMVQDWDLSDPEMLLSALQFLREHVEARTQRTARRHDQGP